MDGQNSSRLRLHTVIPFAWHSVTGGAVHDPAPVRNLEFLRASVLMDEYTPPSTGDAHDETLLRIARIENRVDLLLHLTARILLQHQPLPPSVSVELGTESIEWKINDGSDCPAQGDRLMLDMYLLAGFPFHLTVPAYVRNTVRADDAGMKVLAEFDQMDESVRDILLRYIFRQHRRQIASTRV